MADRNFCFQSFLLGIAKKLGYFVIREHASLNYKLSGKLRKRGSEQKPGRFSSKPSVIEDEEGVKYRFRRIVVKLKKATEDGDWELAILDEPAEERVGGRGVGGLIGKRWTIEGGFQDLTTTFGLRRINTLCYPLRGLVRVLCGG